MNEKNTLEAFDAEVKKKFNLYNSLFLGLPFRNIENIGVLIPVLARECAAGLDAGRDPREILDAFFDSQTGLDREADRIDFMFRVIQYVERQVVLFDSIEDAAFPRIQELGNDLSIRDFINRFAHGRTRDTLAGKLSEFSARIVLTAHPTQFYPSRVLEIIARLRRLIIANRIDEIDITLQQLGLTSLLNQEKPSPLEEARNIIYFLRHVYYDAAGELYALVKSAFGKREFENPDILKLGFWPGGDRDGNPHVTADITSAVADELRMALMKCYYRDVVDLEGKLTFRNVEATVRELRQKLYRAMFDPQTVLCRGEILEPLVSVRETVGRQYNGLYIAEIDSLIDKVKIFRTHFASLDIRQSHDVHREMVERALLREKVVETELGELDREHLLDILLHRQLDIDTGWFDDEVHRDVVSVIGRIRAIQEKNGEEGCNRYIISHAEDSFAVLYVFALFRWCGYDGRAIPVDIVPLFESMAGMENSGAVMETLFELEPYRAHLQQRGDRQTIMLGFSDGTKDGGYLKANWSIFTTKENLSSVCDRFGVKAVFFDGRGGPPARGGGKTHRFYAAQSERIANHEIQVTIQGQTISSKFGTQEHFIHNCEQLLTASLYNSIPDHGNTIPDKARELIDRLARISFEKYRALKHHPQFIPYLQNRSTLKYYGEANIGSRPARRGKTEKLDLEDLRAISYVGSWSQLKQNVPGYFGIGTALRTLAGEGKLAALQDLFNNVPFFKALMLNSMMSLTKSDFRLTRYLGRDENYGDFWNILLEEYELSREMLLRISGYDELMEEEPLSRNSIAIREKIVLPLLVIQQYALRAIEQGTAEKKVYEKIVHRSLYGNINASRNSA